MKIVTFLKSLNARQIFQQCPQVKKKLWGGAFWSSGYFVSTVGPNQSEDAVRAYVQQQGKDHDYQQLHTQPLNPDFF